MDTLDHKLSTELTEMKNILINLQRQIEANRGYSSDATHQTKVRINSTSFFFLNLNLNKEFPKLRYWDSKPAS